MQRLLLRVDRPEIILDEGRTVAFREQKEVFAQRRADRSIKGLRGRANRVLQNRARLLDLAKEKIPVGQLLAVGRALRRRLIENATAELHRFGKAVAPG